jgi:hypothetical protein
LLSPPNQKGMFVVVADIEIITLQTGFIDGESTMNTHESRSYLGATLATLLLAAGSAATPVWGAPPARAAKPQSQSQSYGMGTLSMAQGQYQFYPQGCLHNGNRAVCSFVAVYSGANQANVNAWGGYYGQWTQNMQFVDNAHVPHGSDTAYFIDSFGARQPTLFIQQGTQASITVEFPNVDPAVTAGEFHLGNQIVGGIAVNQANYSAPPGNMNAGGPAPQQMMPQQPAYNGVPGVQGNMPQQQMAMQQSPQQQTCTAQNANSPLCRANDKVTGATTQAAGLSQSAQVLSGTLKSLFGKSTPATAPAPQQQPYVQAAYPQQQQQYPQQQQQPYPQGQYQQQQQYPQGQYPQQQQAAQPQYPQQQPAQVQYAQQPQAQQPR